MRCIGVGIRVDSDHLGFLQSSKYQRFPCSLLAYGAGDTAVTSTARTIDLATASLKTRKAANRHQKIPPSVFNGLVLSALTFADSGINRFNPRDGSFQPSHGPKRMPFRTTGRGNYWSTISPSTVARAKDIETVSLL